MFTININSDVLFIFVTIMTFILIRYYIKRKFDSIDKYNELVSNKPNINTYKDNQNQFKKNIEDSGISTNEEIKFINGIIDFIKNIRGSIF